MNNKSPKIINAMSVDVEDYFQVSAFEPYIARSEWDKIPLRVEQNMARILALFEQKKIKATFFTLGWIAEKLPSMVKEITQQGHEIASHGWSHVRVSQQQRDDFFQDVTRTKHLLEDLTGEAIKGYRAASYSLNKDNYQWAHQVLAETGHLYSSSIFPVKHDLYGMPETPRFIWHPEHADIIEIPITTVEYGKKRIACGGGGWFRFFPYAFSKSAMKRVNKRDKQAVIFYFHPWEIDPDQPHQKNISAKTKFRHYVNLGRTENRLAQLLSDFQWGRMDDIFLNKEQK